MKNNDSDRELEDRLSLLEPSSNSREFEKKLQDLTNDPSEQNSNLAIAGNSKWSLTALGLTTAAVAAVIIISIALLWPQPQQVDQPDTASNTSSSSDSGSNNTTIANFNLAIRRGDDIEELLDRHCNSSLPTHPLTDVSLDGATGFLKQDY